MSVLLGKAIYNILTGSTSLHNYVADKIYPIFAPDETINPFIVYKIKSNNINYSKDGLNFDECIVSLFTVSNTYNECVTITQVVRELLERKTGTFNDVSLYECLVNSVDVNYNIDGYISTIEFAVKSK